MTRFRTFVAVLSIALAGGVLGLSLGLWERSNILINELRDVVGRYTWLVEQREVVGVQPPPLPRDVRRYEALVSLPGVRNLALASISERPVSAFGYPVIVVSEGFFDVRGLELLEGRLPAHSGEAVVGYAQAELLGQTLELGGLAGSEAVQVVGVLASVAHRGWFDASIDLSVLVGLEGYAGLSEVRQLYLEVAPEAFEAVGLALARWLADEGIEGYRVVPLAENFGVALRDRVASLLGGALSFGAVGVMVAAAANLLAFYLARALSRAPQIGVRRAVGASERRIVAEELAAALPWAAVGLLASAPLMYLGNRWLERSLGLSALPGPLTLLLLAISLLTLVGFAALVPALWGARQPPAAVLRGVVRSLPQRRLYLAGIGLALGMAGLVVQAASARSAALESARLLGGVGERVAWLASVIAFDAGTFADPRAQASLRPSDVAALRSDPLAAAFSQIAHRVSYPFLQLAGPTGSTNATLVAHEPAFTELIGLELVSGRLAAPDAFELLLGEDLAQTLFGDAPALDGSVRAFGRDWQVVGIFRAGARSYPGGVSSTVALAPLAMAQAPGGLGSLMVEVAAGVDIDEALTRAAEFLSARFDATQFLPFVALRPVDTVDRLLPVRQTLTSFSAIYRVMALALLLLGGAGLAAQMLVAISLRLREIGIRRAVGASQGRIAAQFLAEALTLALAAAALGLALGTFLSWLVLRWQQVTWTFDGGWVALAVALVLLVAFIFALAPSLIAARLAPARLMREAES